MGDSTRRHRLRRSKRRRSPRRAGRGRRERYEHIGKKEGAFAPLAIVTGCAAIAILACPGDEYSLTQTHPGAARAWQAHYEGFRNLCRGQLCPEGDASCHEEGSFDRFVLEVKSAAHARDRFLFFEACPECRVVDEGLDGGSREFQGAGAFSIQEGRGRVSMTSPPRDMHDPPFWLPQLPTGFVRRYERGACSSEVALSRSGLLERLGEELATTLRNEDSFWGFGASRVEILEQEGRAYLGSEDCRYGSATNRDYVTLRYRLRIEPIWGKGSFEAELRLIWRFVAGSRWQYLACTGQSCAQRDQVTHCSDDDDCAHLAGAQCDSYYWEPTDEWMGYCTNPDTLDIVDSAIEVNRLENSCRNYSCRWRRREIFRNLDELSRYSYRRVFVPMLNSIIEEGFWRELPSGFSPVDTCSSDDECQVLRMGTAELPLSDLGLFGRCGDDELCEVRPNHIYGVNTYPDSFEVILAQNTREGIGSILYLLDLQNDPQDGDLCGQHLSGMTRRQDMSWF
jgi:hypothetical protein